MRLIRADRNERPRHPRQAEFLMRCQTISRQTANGRRRVQPIDVSAHCVDESDPFGHPERTYASTRSIATRENYNK